MSFFSMIKQHSSGMTVTFTLFSQVLFISKSRSRSVCLRWNSVDIFHTKFDDSNKLLYIFHSGFLHRINVHAESYLHWNNVTCTNIEPHEAVIDRAKRPSNRQRSLPFPSIFCIQLHVRTRTCVRYGARKDDLFHNNYYSTHCNKV